MKKLVLLVDDEEIIRLTSGEILEELGFDVITAATGNEAIEIYRNKFSDISLVIIDMTLPDISGMELFNSLKKINSENKFLFTSGYRQDMVNPDSEITFIQKPYTISELSERLNKLLGE